VISSIQGQVLNQVSLIKGYITRSLIGVMVLSPLLIGAIHAYQSIKRRTRQAKMDEQPHFLLAFDNGEFPECGTSSIVDWFAQTPPAVFAQNTCITPKVIAHSPTAEAYIAQGEVPPDEPPQFSNKQIQTNESPHKCLMGVTESHRP
jgi:hypothetical protein